MSVGRVLWPELLSPGERAQLRPGLAPRIDRAPDLLVVGGGMLGVATALRAQQAGCGSVVLLEREHLAAGASGGAAGQLLPEAHAGIDPPVLVDLARRGLELWRELDREIAGGLNLIELAGRQARLNPVQAIARIAVHLPGAVTGVTVEAITASSGRLRTVHTSAGDFSPGAVVFATGNPPHVGGLDLDLPWSEVKGHMLVTEPTDLRLPAGVAPLATSIDGGRLMVGGTLDVDDTERVVRPEVVAAMRAALVAAWPPAARLRVGYQWACFRPAHPDRLPVVDRVPGIDNAWLTSGHYKTGILVAPATAHALVDWIQSGQRPTCLTGLGADRFART